MFTRIVTIVAILTSLYLNAFVTYALPKGKAIATYYDDSEGAGGVWLNKYPSKRVYIHKIRKSVRLYPVAVYSDRVRRLKYKVIQLKKGSTRIFAHVVDECGSGDCHTNKWIARKRGAVLFDLHRSAWNAMRFKEPRIIYGITYTVVGTISRKNKSIDRLLTKDGRQGYVPGVWT